MNFQTHSKQFVPIYDVGWISKSNEAAGYGAAVWVELYLLEKQLLQLTVNDANYIMREPVVIENSDSLFPGKAPVDVFTNYSKLKHVNLY
jgi:hypothetical protein